MEFLGIGPLELLFILLIALIVIGPRDMLKTGRNLGKMLRKVVTSPQWQTVTRTSREIRNIPTRLIREAGLEEMQEELNGLKKATTDIQNTLLSSTVLPVGWAGNTQSLKQTNTTVQTKSASDQFSNSDVILPTPDTGSVDSESIPTTNVIAPPAYTMSGNSPNDLSAWISEPDEDVLDINATETDPNDLTAWITPPHHRRRRSYS